MTKEFEAKLLALVGNVQLTPQQILAVRKFCEDLDEDAYRRGQENVYETQNY